MILSFHYKIKIMTYLSIKFSSIFCGCHNSRMISGVNAIFCKRKERKKNERKKKEKKKKTIKYINDKVI